MKQYLFHSDPGHGWLEVPETDLAALGMKKRDFSSYSYQKDEVLYLEEDDDASKFINRYKEIHGDFKYTVQDYNDEAPIRNYRRI